MSKKRKRIHPRTKLSDIERVVDLLERIGAAGLYLGTDLNQNQIARKLGMDTNRANIILKGIKKK